MKCCVFTAIFGAYDTPKQPKVVVDGVDYFMFSDDSKLNPPYPWKLVLCKPGQASSLMNAKHIKIMAHRYLSSEYDSSLWIDGNIQLRCNPKSLWDSDEGTCDIVLIQHDARACLHVEVEVCTRANLDKASVLKSSSDLYFSLDFDSPTGLYFGGFVGRRHTKASVRFNRLWWLCVLNGTTRDQIHLPPALELSGVSYSIIPTQDRSNLFRVKSHNKVI